VRIPAKPIEEIVVHAARTSGCTDDQALLEAVQAAGQNGGKFIDSVLDAAILPDESAFFDAIGRAIDVPFMPTPELDPAHPPHLRLSARLALRHRVLPGAGDAVRVQLLTYDPFDLEARQMAGQNLDQNVAWVLSTRTAILAGLRSGYGVGAGHFDALIEDKASDAEPDALRQEVTVLGENEEATIMSFVNQIFTEAIRQRHRHSQTSENDLRIRYRNGWCSHGGGGAGGCSSAAKLAHLAVENHGASDIAERGCHRMDRSISSSGTALRRAHRHDSSVNGEGVSLASSVASARSKQPRHGRRAQEKPIAVLPNGIILVTDPTGCGKSRARSTRSCAS
jgi:general secretion pathway protein E/type IV pilus assembly protein PilB